MLAVRLGESDFRYALDGHSRQIPASMAFFISRFLIHQAEVMLKEKVPFSDASIEVCVNEDRTVFSLTCRTQFEECLSLLLKGVTSPRFTQEKLNQAKIRAAQRMADLKKNPSQQLQWQLQEGLYGMQVPSEDDFAEITLETMERIHRAFYRASNIALCTAGDMDPERIFRLASACVPSEDGRKLRCELTVPEEETAGGLEKAIAMDVQETSFLLGFRAVSENSVRQRVLGKLAMQAFAGENSPLCQRLHQEGLLTSRLCAELHASARKTYFTFCGCSSAPARTAEEIINEAIRISWQGLDSRDFIRAKRAIYGREIMKLDHVRDLCIAQAEYHLFGLQWMQFPKVLNNIKKDDVEEMLRECIADEKSFLSIVYPKGVY